MIMSGKFDGIKRNQEDASPPGKCGHLVAKVIGVASQGD